MAALTEQGTRLHVTLGMSAAHTLRRALARLSCSEQVLALADDYSVGPLDPGDAVQRAAWEREELREDEPIATSIEVASFWAKVSSWPGKIVVWMSSRSVVELCGLHALSWRLPAADIDVIDIANVEFRPEAGRSNDERHALAVVRDDRIVEHGLIDLAVPISDLQRASLRNQWQRLQQEDAPLRVLTTKGLESAPIDYFDDRIRARVTDSWQSCARVVGSTMETVRSGPLVEFNSDAFVFCRLLHLIDSDEVEGESEEELWSMHRSKVRRSTRR